MARKLIMEDPRFGGRGRPAILVTTELFSRRFGLTSLSDLPPRQRGPTKEFAASSSPFPSELTNGDNQRTEWTVSMAIRDLELESRPPLTVEEFDALAKTEGWDEDIRVELLDGEIVWMSPINDPHAASVNRLNQLFSRRYAGDVALVAVQNPIRIEHYDEPQPDVALLKPRLDFYATATPTPADILLLVEVADTTLRTDLGRKARIYASGGVTEYWVVDLNNRVLYVHRSPARGTYAERQVLASGERVAAGFAPHIELGVEEVTG